MYRELAKTQRRETTLSKLARVLLLTLIVLFWVTYGILILVAGVSVSLFSVEGLLTLLGFFCSFALGIMYLEE